MSSRSRFLLILALPLTVAVLSAQDPRPTATPPSKVRDDARAPNRPDRLTPDELRRETESDDEGEAERKAAIEFPKAKNVPIGERGTRRLPQFTRPGFEAPKVDRAATTTPITPRLVPDKLFGLDATTRTIIRTTADAIEGPSEEAIRATARADGANFQITLKNTFIEKYKNRVTIHTPFRVVKASPIHPAEDDGEIHIAGLSDEVGLACVAEIMQAKDENAAVATVRAAIESEDMLNVTGAWRLWCEHPSKKPQIQDDVIPEYKNSNPDHVFEIHPVSRFGSHDVRDTFKPIAGFEPKEAKRAFKYYDSIPCHIFPDPDNQTTSLFTAKAKFNFTEFILKVEDDEQFITPDGRIVRCSVLDLNRHEVTKNRRMVFVRDTPPEREIKALGKGSELHVLGIPRIDLALVSWRVRNASTKPEALHWDLPYEIIVVGVYVD